MVDIVWSMRHQIIITSKGKISTYKGNFILKTVMSSAGRQAPAQAMVLVVDPLSTSSLFSSRVTVPLFEIHKEPTIKLSDIKTRRFNIIDRA